MDFLTEESIGGKYNLAKDKVEYTEKNETTRRRFCESTEEEGISKGSPFHKYFIQLLLKIRRKIAEIEKSLPKDLSKEVINHFQ